MALLLDYAQAVFDVAAIVVVQTLMLLQVTFGFYRLKGEALELADDEPLKRDATLSIVIPAYREASTIEATLRRVAQAASWPARCEVVVVDAGGGDGTMAIVARVAAELDLDVVTTTSKGGRGPAVAAGALKAKCQALLVLHADTTLPYAFDDRIVEALGAKGVFACCFRFAVDRAALPWPHGVLRWLRVLPFEVMERTVAVRASVFQLPFGDQAIAFRKTTFAALGGFGELARVPMLEDYLFVQKLRRLGACLGGRCIRVLPVPARCHPRRWLAKSVWRVNWTNQLIMVQVAYRGLTPQQVFELYYGQKV